MSYEITFEDSLQTPGEDPVASCGNQTFWRKFGTLHVRDTTPDGQERIIAFDSPAKITEWETETNQPGLAPAVAEAIAEREPK